MFGNTTTTKKRRLARSLEHAAKPERLYIGRGPRYLVHPEVAVACAPSLRAIAAALRDETVAFDDEQFRAIRSFVNDGSSTFFGRGRYGSHARCRRPAAHRPRAEAGRRRHRRGRDGKRTETCWEPGTDGLGALASSPRRSRSRSRFPPGSVGCS